MDDDDEMYAKRRNSRDLMEIGAEKHDGDVSF